MPVEATRTLGCATVQMGLFSRRQSEHQTDEVSQGLKVRVQDKQRIKAKSIRQCVFLFVQ